MNHESALRGSVMFIDRRRMEGRALRQECYVIQKTDNLYAAVKHSTPDGVRRSMLSRSINMPPLTGQDRL